MIFTLDVGSGTQDFLLYAEENIRNCPKAILPSPTRIVAAKIRACSKSVYLHGYTMGGGAIKFAVREHIAKGYEVYADKRAALTLADNLEKVRAMGVKISPPEGDFESIETRDVDVDFFSDLIRRIGYPLPETFAIAVQDHGYSPHESNRVFRFKMFRKLLGRNAKLSSLIFRHDEIPKEFNRMVDAAKCIRDKMDVDVYVVDTVFAAIAGCAAFAKLPALLVNFGNSHLTAAVVDEDLRVLSLLEHHTKVVAKRGRRAIAEMLQRFVRGELSFDDIFNDGGHGCYVREVVEVKDAVCTGPNAHLGEMREPGGDPMIVGNIGILLLLAERGVADVPRLF